MSLYALGVDFGTLSGRTVLVDLATGEERASAVYEYPHGVMDTALPDGTPLGDDWALEHPRDWIGVLQVTIPAVLEPRQGHVRTRSWGSAPISRPVPSCR